MNNKHKDICEYLGINTSNDELVSGYDESIFDYGEWYQFDFRGENGKLNIQEYAYSKDRDFPKNPQVINAMKSKGCTHYYRSLVRNGKLVPKSMISGVLG